MSLADTRQRPRVGETWVDREGREWVLSLNKGIRFLQADYPFSSTDGMQAWTSEGKYYMHAAQSPYDLVRRVVTPAEVFKPIYPGAPAAEVISNTAPQLDALGATLAERRASHGTDNPYSLLWGVLNAAYDQAATGKGADRHQNYEGERFEDQDILAIPARYGASLAAPAFQVEKKLREANRMVSRGEYDAAKREILGAIIYSAAAYLLTEAQENRNK